MEREELINNIIKSPANRFGENERDRGCLEATDTDTLMKLRPVDIEEGQTFTENIVTDEEPLVAPSSQVEPFQDKAAIKQAFENEDEEPLADVENVDKNAPLVAPVMSFEK